MFEHVKDEELLNALRRFLSKVEDYSSENICWVWKAGISWDGYGRFGFRKKHWRSHRWAYWLTYGNLTDGLQIDHLCKNRACVNPLHLEEVDQPTNLLRGYVFNKEKIHCKRGHEFTAENTYSYIYGGTIRRKCKECARLRWKNML